MEFDLNSLLNTAVQLPIVGVFIWVVFRFMKEHREERKEVETLHREEREAITERFANSLDKSTDAIDSLDSTITGWREDMKQ